MARAWRSRLRAHPRQAEGAPLDAGLGLVAQKIWRSGSGQAQRRGASAGGGQREARRPASAVRAPGPGVGPAPAHARRRAGRRRRRGGRGTEAWLEELDPGAGRAGAATARPPARRCLSSSTSPSRTAASRSSTPPARRNARASVRIAVDLAIAGAITARRRCCASSRATSSTPAPADRPAAPRDVFGPASPPARRRDRAYCLRRRGRAGRRRPGRGDILVRPRPPEDIRGMHFATAS